MKKLLALIIILNLSVQVKAQIFSDLNPDNAIYSKIQYAQLPDELAGNKGHAFFTIGYNDYKKFVLTTAETVLYKNLEPYFQNKFAGEKWIYTDYKLMPDDIYTATNATNKLLIDTTTFLVTATKNSYKWSWKLFKRVLVPMATDTIYKVKASLLNDVKSTELVYLYKLQNKKMWFSLTRNGSKVFERDFSPADQLYIAPLLLPVNELLIRQKYILNTILPEGFNLMKTPDAIVAYIAIK